MKFYKSADLFIQVFLVILLLVSFFAGDGYFINPSILLFTFAAVQIISIIIHTTTGPKPWKMRAWRKYHLIGIVLILLGIVIAFIQNDAGRTGDKDDKYNMAGLGTLIYISIPAVLLAVLYILISFAEWNKMKKTQQ